MSDPNPRKRYTSPPEPTDDMRAWLRNEGTILCERPDGSRRACTAAEFFAGPHRTDHKPATQEAHAS